MPVLSKSLKRISKLPQQWGISLVAIRRQSWWSQIKAGAPDPIFSVTEAYRADANPQKVLLGVGAYRTDEGMPFILPCVQRAKDMLGEQKLDHEYLPQGGYSEFNRAAARLALGEESDVLKNGLNLTVQALGGTGAIRLGMTFLSRFHTGCKVVYIPNPTWNNHKNISLNSGMEWKFYKYYNPEQKGMNFCGMCEDIENIPEKSIILFHAIAHNPTGFDPSPDQWKRLSNLCMERNLFVFFDMAYQGFATGDAEKDASSVRQFIKDGHQVAVAQSFSKNMGLYGERIGALTLVTNPLVASKEELERVNSQMKIVIRAMYSNPPLYGARVVSQVLNEQALRCQWLKDIKGMANRIQSVRQLLVAELKKVGSEKNWEHICKQIGMFSFTGLNKEQVEKLTKEHSVYLTADGRISVASLGGKNIPYVARAIHEVSK
uniref:Aspartate aminotransferase n=1 Tax=Dendroctonus ponderosae TaxID=77166 RepID=J3JUH5_DENPD|nr:unknown [Dendroctonus ponderosae]